MGILRGLTRREFLKISGVLAAGTAAGCAIDPVTGEQTFVIMGRDQEIALDAEYSPHQFSADYGASQDRALNAYLDNLGQDLAQRSHRPDMPYSFRAVNATYVNAYAFPGGSIACTRGVLLSMDNEAELAALMGHEIGHVNARHSAEQQSQGLLINVLVAGLTAVVAAENEDLAPLTAGLGGIGAGALLASYSRDNEREADALGMEYMVRSGYNPEGMVGLMDVLRSLSKEKPNAIEMMFSTHPMSQERYDTAVHRVKDDYPYADKMPVHRERYMDHTARLRRMAGAIEHMQNAEEAMVKHEYSTAMDELRTARRQAPGDYTALVLSAKCLLAMKRYREAERYAREAVSIYPAEAQARHVAGMARMELGDYDGAHHAFKRYEQMLPGNPNTVFLKGYSLEKKRDYGAAAQEYFRYLELDSQSEQADYAYRRLVEWGYVTPQK